MKKAIEITIVIILLISNVSCRKTLAKGEYVQYVKDKNNGLNKMVKVGPWDYCFQYKPHDYVILLEELTSLEKEKRGKELEGTAWFNISFHNRESTVSALRYELTSKDAYDKRLDYFLNHAIDDVKLIYGTSDTLLPIAYAFENNYNLTPQETIVVGFRLPIGEKAPTKDMQIVYDDRVYKSGIIKAKIAKESIENIPNIAL